MPDRRFDGTSWHGRAAPSTGNSAQRRWERVTRGVRPPRAITLRWLFLKTAPYTGRGVYLDGLRITDRRGTLLDGERDPRELAAVGWAEARR